jgi:hypothetical protein
MPKWPASVCEHAKYQNILLFYAFPSLFLRAKHKENVGGGNQTSAVGWGEYRTEKWRDVLAKLTTKKNQDAEFIQPIILWFLGSLYQISYCRYKKWPINMEFLWRESEHFHKFTHMPWKGWNESAL